MLPFSRSEFTPRYPSIDRKIKKYLCISIEMNEQKFISPLFMSLM